MGTSEPGATFIDHTSASARLSRELYETAKARGLQLLDAPVSGGQSGAEKSALAVMVGGEEQAFARCADANDLLFAESLPLHPDSLPESLTAGGTKFKMG
ncbi:MAG: NAD(P)-binding domain-containing protein [Candidatus Binatia bacterium]